MKTLNDYLAVYKEQLEKGDIQKAYFGLMKSMMSLKSSFSDYFSDTFSFGNISQGYMDFTYFPFFNEFLREKKLRFGIILNHEKMRFEIWLMGQNAEVQKNYWNILKITKWNRHLQSMPKYSVLEAVLVKNPDFNKLDLLTEEMRGKVSDLSNEIISYLKTYHAKS